MSEARVRASDAQWEVFAPLGGPRAEAIVQRMSDAITRGQLNRGEQLPPEIDMAQQFGVSTLTVREALAELRRDGLVKTRRGRGGGSFVATDLDVVPLLRRQLAGVTLSELRDRGDEHTAVAGAAASLAAERADSLDVARLRGLAKLLADSDDAEQRRRADARFHIDVAVASQSMRLTRSQVRLQGESSAQLWLLAGAILIVDDVVADHCELVDAIEARDQVGARQAAERHVARASRALSATFLDVTAS